MSYWAQFYVFAVRFTPHLQLFSLYYAVFQNKVLLAHERALDLRTPGHQRISNFFPHGRQHAWKTLFESFHVGIVPYASEIECILECDERNNIAGLFAFHFRWFYWRKRCGMSWVQALDRPMDDPRMRTLSHMGYRVSFTGSGSVWQ